MLQQEIDYGFHGGVAVGLELHVIEPLVPAHQLRRRRIQYRDYPLQLAAGGRSFEIFDRVELDTAPLEQFKAGARKASAGVVIQGHAVHILSPWRFCL